MAPRANLQELLESFVDNVYFQPPANVQMKYPCIVYQRDNLDVKHANNLPYDVIQRYQVTVIDRNPDSAIPLKIAALPRSSFDRFFVAEGLNHDVFRLYF